MGGTPIGRSFRQWAALSFHIRDQLRVLTLELQLDVVRQQTNVKVTADAGGNFDGGSGLERVGGPGLDLVVDARAIRARQARPDKGLVESLAVFFFSI